MTKKLLLFAGFMVALVLINVLGASVAAAIGYAAQFWVEFFAGLGYQEIAFVGAPLIGISGIIAMIVLINRIELWWKLRKMQWPLL